VQAVLEDNPGHVRRRTIPDPHLAADAPGLATEVGVVVPQSWEEMHRWRPALQREFAGRRWLLLAQPRIAGMFLTFLPGPPLCGIVGSPATPEEFLAEFRALVEGRPRCPPARLAARINAALRAMPGKEQTPALETRELECGCAISLGLSNRQIARTLLLSEGTVRNPLTNLYRKLGAARREAAGALIEEAGFASSVPR